MGSGECFWSFLGSHPLGTRGTQGPGLFPIPPSEGTEVPPHPQCDSRVADRGTHPSPPLPSKDPPPSAEPSRRGLLEEGLLCLRFIYTFKKKTSKICEDEIEGQSALRKYDLPYLFAFHGGERIPGVLL